MSYKFILKCIDKGITSFNDICEESKKEAELIQKKISLLEQEKAELSLYLKDLKNIKSSDSTQKNSSVVVVTTKWEELSDSIIFYCKNIVNKLDSKSSIRVNDIMSSSFDENKMKDNRLAIKWLMDQKIILRVGQDVLRGTCWNDRPKDLKEISND